MLYSVCFQFQVAVWTVNFDQNNFKLDQLLEHFVLSFQFTLWPGTENLNRIYFRLMAGFKTEINLLQDITDHCSW